MRKRSVARLERRMRPSVPLTVKSCSDGALVLLRCLLVYVWFGVPPPRFSPLHLKEEVEKGEKKEKFFFWKMD